MGYPWQQGKAGPAHYVPTAIRWRLPGALLACLFCLTAPAWASSPDKPCAELRVMLDWALNPDHGPLVVAETRGLFAAHGLCVELLEPQDSQDNIQALMAGEVDLALSYQIQTQIQAAEGTPLRVIGSLIDSPLNTVLALQSSGIERLADLQGKVVGYADNPKTQAAILAAMLRNVAVDPASVKLVDVEFALDAVLLSGKADAVIDAYRNYEPLQLALADHATTEFYVEDYGIPNYSQLIYVADRRRLDHALFEQFLAAIAQATSYLQQQPEQAWQAYGNYRPGLDSELNRRAWQMTASLFAPDPRSVDPLAYRTMSKFLQEQGLLESDAYLTELLADHTAVQSRQSEPGSAVD